MSSRPNAIPISIRGRYLWRGDTRFFVRGVAYQTHDARDPISDDQLVHLEQDIPLFKELGLNTIFVYSIDNTKEHDKAMALLEEAGIYVLTSVSTPFCAINRMSPYRSYNSGTMTHFFKTVDLMSKYPNTLGILAANSLINNEASLCAAPVLKAIVRDIKRYMGMKNEIKGQRILPISYSAPSGYHRNVTILDYLSSGDASRSIDFWTLCSYMWAGESSMQISGYNHLVQSLQHTSIPIFFSEYGANIPHARLFQETRAIYSDPKMVNLFSGGCVYEFWNSGNQYGLVELFPQTPKPESSAYQEALLRADDEEKVAEKRETERGTLLVFHDFVNYKNSLAATKGVEESWDRETSEGQGLEAGVRNMQLGPWPWEPEFQEPETCVDWRQIEEAVRNEA